ncbi:MAG TPA: tetratricopeptide repeat protein [Bacteroidales bacterium]|nr:tetratricopeptide repeat protein [Bacteroidales bacterium]HPS17025.1 tetratricopeptide repeat protein [Bacteroidales bacterium]
MKNTNQKNSGNKNQKNISQQNTQKQLKKKPDTNPYYILFLIAFLIYSNSLFNAYTLDDRLTITDNAFTKQGVKGIDDILSHDTFVGFFGIQKNLVAGGRYRPMSLITFALEYQLFGLSPFISHLINILMYAFSCVLIYKVLLMLFPADKNTKWYLTIPFLASVLFAAHPLHVECVANIKGRDELMSFLGSFAALYFILKYLEDKKILHLILAQLIFFVGLMSKENTITFVAVVPLTLLFFRKANIIETIKQTVFLFITSIVFILIRYKVLGFFMGASIDNELLNNPFIDATAMQKFATVLLTWGKYLILLVFPHPLTHDYYPKQIPIINMTDVRAIIPLLIYVGLIVFAILKLKKRNVVSYGILYFMFTFSIVSNLVFSIGTFMNDRFMYMPLLGFTIIAAYFFNWLMTKKNVSEKTIILIGSVLLLGYSVKTFSRNFVWKNDYTLFTTDVKVSPNSAKCNVSAGGLSLDMASEEKDPVKKKKYIEDALTYLNKGVTIHPKYDAGWVLLGRAMIFLEDYKKAREYFKITLTLNPTQKEALNNWLYCAQQSAKNKDYAEAVESYKGLLQYKKLDDDLYIQIATVYEDAGKTDSAIATLDTLILRNPQYAPAYSKMGEIYGKVLNNIDKSLEYLLKAYSIKADDASLLENLGIAYGIKKDYAQSILYFEKALVVSPDNYRIYSNMSGTYHNMGNDAKAKECLQKAAELQKKEESSKGQVVSKE